MKILCVFGRYQYGDPARGLGTEYLAFIPALRALGHEVCHYDSWGGRHDLVGLNRRLVAVAEAYQPNIVLMVPMEYEIWLETLRRIATVTEAAIVLWNADDTWKYHQVPRYLMRGAHLGVTTDWYSVSKYVADGHEVVLSQWAPLKLLPPLPSAKCTLDVSFVGAADSTRRRWIRALARKGVRVECFGYGWPNGPLRGEEITDIFRSSKISLNFANSRGRRQIKARTFEVTGAGGFLLTERVPLLEKFFELGKEIETFTTAQEAAEKVVRYLERPDLRDAIAGRGYERVCKDHTYERRLAHVLHVALAARARRTVQPITAEDYEESLSAYKSTGIVRATRAAWVALAGRIVGQRKAMRIGRRLVFELSWRISGERTFTAAGLPGRMFPGV